MFRRTFAVAASTLLALAACSSTPSAAPTQGARGAVPVTLAGAVQKGPFVLGSSVTVTPAMAGTAALMQDTKSSAALAADDSSDAADAADGKVYKTETSNDRGEFSVSLAYQGPAAVEATGYWYNEALGQLSGAPLTLRAFTAVGDADTELNVNLVTHLTYQRVRNLMAGGLEFAEASAQAESELQAELGFGDAPSTAAAKLSLEGGDNAESAYLFAVSTVFAQAAYLDSRTDGCSNCVDAKVQELVNTTSAAFATVGTLPSATKDKLAQARATIDNAKVEAALAARLEEIGSKANVPSLDRVIPWSVPESVTDCASSMVPTVSMDCRMSLCGATTRPLDTSAATALRNWQTLWSADYCGNDCWTAMRCFATHCSVVLSGGARVINSVCEECSNVAFGKDALMKPSADLAEVAIEAHQCDADLGLAK